MPRSTACVLSIQGHLVTWRYRAPRYEGMARSLLPVPEDLGLVEQEHRKFHQLAHIALKHARPGKTRYSAEEEQYAEVFADAMMARG